MKIPTSGIHSLVESPSTITWFGLGHGQMMVCHFPDWNMKGNNFCLGLRLGLSLITHSRESQLPHHK